MDQDLPPSWYGFLLSGCSFSLLWCESQEMLGWGGGSCPERGRELQRLEGKLGKAAKSRKEFRGRGESCSLVGLRLDWC